MRNYNEKIAYKKGYRVNKEGIVTYKSNTIKLTNHRGYNFFNIKSEGKKLNVKVHRLQAYTKFGEEIYKEGVEVRHLNGIRNDNSWDNIAIGTRKDNALDIPAEKREKIAVKASTELRVYTDEELIKIRKDREQGLTYSQLMAKYNISSKGTIYYILHTEYKTRK